MCSFWDFFLSVKYLSTAITSKVAAVVFTRYVKTAKQLITKNSDIFVLWNISSCPQLHVPSLISPNSDRKIVIVVLTFTQFNQFNHI